MIETNQVIDEDAQKRSIRVEEKTSLGQKKI